MDKHICGDCQGEFDSYENFLIHKLLDEKYKLILESSIRIPTVLVPKFIKGNQGNHIPLCNSGQGKPLVNSPHILTPAENEVERSKVESDGSSVPKSSPVMESPYSVEVDVAHSEVVSDDDLSVGSQPESLRIDESAGIKETSSSVPCSPSELENDEKKQYYCKKCKRYYKNKVVLRVHEETVHSSNRPHVCTSCRQGFKTKGSLVRHTRTHTGERPFSCGECKKAYLDSGTLARHAHRVHRKQPFKQACDVKVFITSIA